MLEACDSTDLITRLWDSADDRAVIPPDEEANFFSKAGIMPQTLEDRRRWRRFYNRRQAILRTEGTDAKTYGVYCRDISQSGVGVLIPQQLLPLEQCKLILSTSKILDLRVRRCNRLDQKAFVIGCDFDVDPRGGPRLW